MTVCFRFFSRCPIPLSCAGIVIFSWLVAASCADAPRGAIVRDARVDSNHGAGLGAGLALTWARCASVSLGWSERLGGEQAWLEHAWGRERIAVGGEGRARLRGIAPGAWRLVVQRSAARWERGVELACGHNVLSGVASPRPSGIWGRVVGKGRKPLEGAWITLRAAGGGEERHARSGLDGSFVMEGMAAGRYALRVVAPGRQVVRRTVELPRGVVLRTLPARSVKGVVRGARGADVEVLLVGPALRRRSRVGPSGHFEFAGLLPGSYEVFALTSKAPWRASELMVVRAGKGALEVALQPAKRLRGRVAGEDGAPLPARVVLRPVRAVLFSAEVMTDARGVFVAPPLPVGRYRVEAWAAGWLPSLGRTVDLAKESGQVLLRLGRGHAVKGRVVDGAGHPVRGALVRFFPGGRSLGGKVGELGVVPGPVPPIPPLGAPLSTRARGSRLWSATTDGRGQFSVKGIPGGKVRYSVEHTDYDIEEGGLGVPRAAPLALRLRRAKGIAGAVSDWRTGAPITRFFVRVDDRAKKRFRGARGRFLLKLEPGKRRLVLGARGYAREERVVDVSGRRGERRRGDLLFELKAAGIIEGTIRDALGRPVAGAKVRAAGASSRSNSRGEFELEEVPEGSHVVELSVGGTTQRSDPISVRAGERSGPVRFHLTTP